MTKAKSKQRKAKGKEDEEKSSGVEEQQATLLCSLPSGEGIPISHPPTFNNLASLYNIMVLLQVITSAPRE